MANDGSANPIDVVVVGLGVIGLPFAAVLAQIGHRVCGVDVNPSLVKKLQGGAAISSEPDVIAMLSDPDTQERLEFSTTIPAANTYIICVPTPLQITAKRADLGYVEAASRAVAAAAPPTALVIVESTVPPRTLRSRVLPLFEEVGKQGVRLAHAPERLLPGNVVHELVHNDRIVGGLTDEATTLAARLYASFSKAEVLQTDADTAEFVKLLENTYRDVNVALANELAQIARNLSIDPAVAFALANRHPRVSILSPGIGVGGHCLPIDPWFLHEADPETAVLIATARRVNDGVPARVGDALHQWFSKTGRASLLLLGRSYKKDVWDPRESPAVKIGAALQARGVKLRQWDPLDPDDGEPPVVDETTAVALLVSHRAMSSFLAALPPELPAVDASSGSLQVLRHE